MNKELTITQSLLALLAGSAAILTLMLYRSGAPMPSIEGGSHMFAVTLGCVVPVAIVMSAVDLYKQMATAESRARIAKRAAQDRKHYY